jgi:multidrug efflux pump
LLIVYREPGANIIETVDAFSICYRRCAPRSPPSIQLSVMLNATTTIRASVRDIEMTLLISLTLVVLVVFIFLRSLRSTLIPAVAVPVSLIGTFGGMYLLGYSLDNLSLMALTIATGFVVDDAIVVIENVSRHLEEGLAPLQAALRGAKEIGFTVVSISVSLVAVFIPILLMGGIIGRLFREFAVTLTMAIVISMVVSLTTTPMMCAALLRSRNQEKHGRVYTANERLFDWILRRYETSLGWVLRHQPLVLLVTLLTMGATGYIYVKIPKGFFPQQDTGRINGSIQGDQDVSFQEMRGRITQLAKLVVEDPAVDSVMAFNGGGLGRPLNTGNMFMTLKPLAERNIRADQVIGRLRAKLARIPAITLYMQPVQDLRVGGRSSNAQYQYTLQSDSVQDLLVWGPRMLAKLRTVSGLLDVNSDQQNKGLQAGLVIDRATAARLGITAAMIDNTLYDAFGQRQVSTMYTQLNQYHVVLEVEPTFWQNPEGLKHIYVKPPSGGQVPLATFAHYEPSTSPLVVNHQGQFPAVTLSFNLRPGLALGDAVDAVEQAAREIGLPASIHGSFQGTAQAFQSSLATEPLLIAAALATVYVVLGVLYESTIHPVTISPPCRRPDWARYWRCCFAART